MSISQSITRDVIFTDLKIGSLQKDQVLWYYSCGYIAYKKTTAVKYFELKNKKVFCSSYNNLGDCYAKVV